MLAYNKNRYIALLTFVLLFNVALAQQNRGLFDCDSLLELTVSTDLKTLLRDVGDENFYHPAKLLYLDNNNNPVEIAFKIKTRGHFRKDPTNCNFPPLRFKFKDEKTQHTIFSGFKKLKLVTHCRNNENYQQHVVLEYLMYKTYALFSDMSYQVRLARITYIDTENNLEPLVRFAFFIEPTSRMAARNNSSVLNARNVHPDKTNYAMINTLSVFQYMIGNTDWSVATLHNIRLLRDDPYQPPVAVPYDFDWTGLVNAPYAKPAPHLGLSSVRERLFRGYPRTQNEFDSTFSIFNAKKEAVLDLYRNCQFLDEKNKKKSIRYLDDFYDIINNKRSIEYEFVLNARRD